MGMCCFNGSKNRRYQGDCNLHRGKDSTYFDSKNHAIVSEIAPGSTFKLNHLYLFLRIRF